VWRSISDWGCTLPSPPPFVRVIPPGLRLVNMAISHAQANFCRQCGRDLRVPAGGAAACTVCGPPVCVDPLNEAADETHYTQFRNEILRDMVRCLGVPVTTAAAAAYCVDPVKEAQAEAIRLANGTDTYASIHARSGRDWQREFTQAKRWAEIQEAESRHRRVVRIFTVCCLVMSIVAITLGTLAMCSVLSSPSVELREIVDRPPLVVRPEFRSVEYPY